MICRKAVAVLLSGVGELLLPVRQLLISVGKRLLCIADLSLGIVDLLLIFRLDGFQPLRGLIGQQLIQLVLMGADQLRVRRGIGVHPFGIGKGDAGDHVDLGVKGFFRHHRIAL